MGKRRIDTEAAPGAVGPYSQGVQHGDFVFTSGQLPKPADGDLITGDIALATRQCLLNVQAVLEAAGAAMAEVVKVTVFLTDLADFALVNTAYGEFFREPYPARSCIEVNGLPKGAAIEIEAVAIVGKR